MKILSLFFLLLSLQVFAQSTFINTQGETIVINGDGTWANLGVVTQSVAQEQTKSTEQIELEKLLEKAKLLQVRENQIDNELSKASRKPHPRYDCQKTQDLDELTGNLVQRTEYRELFRYTSKLIEKQFPEQNYLTCFASIGSSVNGLSLDFKYEFQSLTAEGEYGGLRPKQKIIFTFIDGRTLELICTKDSKVDYDVDARKTYIFEMIPLNRNDAEALANKEVSKIKIDWNTGFEEYDIIHVDFFIKAFNCL